MEFFKRKEEEKKKFIIPFLRSSSSMVLRNLRHSGACPPGEKVVRFSKARSDWQRSQRSSLLRTIDLARQRAQRSRDSMFTRRSATSRLPLIASFYITATRFIVNEQLGGTKARPEDTSSSGSSSEGNSTEIAAAAYRRSPFLENTVWRTYLSTTVGMSRSRDAPLPLSLDAAVSLTTDNSIANSL